MLRAKIEDGLAEDNVEEAKSLLRKGKFGICMDVFTLLWQWEMVDSSSTRSNYYARISA